MHFVEDQIGGGVGAGTSLSYIVPCSGSTTQNTIPTPAPSTSEGPRICSQLVANNNCTPLQERLRTLVDVTLAAGDQVTIPNGDHDFAGNSQNEVQASLNTLTAQLLLQQNNQNSNVVTINPFDSGYLTVILVCNESFACKDVDPNSLSFGPNGAFPVSTKLGDFNKDGIDDLFIKVRQPDTGITCSDTAATLSGNVTITVGSNTYPLPFHSTIGFAISSSGCP